MGIKFREVKIVKEVKRSNTWCNQILLPELKQKVRVLKTACNKRISGLRVRLGRKHGRMRREANVERGRSTLSPPIKERPCLPVSVGHKSDS